MIREAAPHLAPWVTLWQAAIPRFQPESLYSAGAGPALRRGNVYVQPLRNMYPPDEDASATFEILSADSPDGRYKLVFDWYQRIWGEEGEIEIGGEPDSSPLLLDLRDSVSNAFAFCGTPCGFHWGTWISPTRFVLAGWTELDDGGSRLQGTLKIYSIPDSTVLSYVTREVSADVYSRYRTAWEAWVAERYHALKLHAAREGADLAKVAVVAR